MFTGHSGSLSSPAAIKNRQVSGGFLGILGSFGIRQVESSPSTAIGFGQ
jgi:hypothetical protein